MENKQKMKKTLLAVIPVESPLYIFHPITRLILFVITGFIPLFIDMPEVNLIFIVFTVLLFIYSRVDLKSMKIYVPMMVMVGVFTFLTYIFFPGKDPSYIRIGSFLGTSIYYQPMLRAIVAYIKIIALILSSIFYFSTNRERDILAAMRTLKIPFVISYVFGLSLRSAGMFLEDLHVVREAEQARGLDYSTMKLGNKIRLYCMYIIPLLTIALRRSDEISNALYVKGYSLRSGVRRPDYILTKYSYCKKDAAAAVVLVTMLIAIIILNLKFHMFSSEYSVFRYILK